MCEGNCKCANWESEYNKRLIADKNNQIKQLKAQLKSRTEFCNKWRNLATKLFKEKNALLNKKLEAC